MILSGGMVGLKHKNTDRLGAAPSSRCGCLYIRGDTHYAGTDIYYAATDTHYAGARCDIRGSGCRIAKSGSHFDGSMTQITPLVSAYARVNIDIRGLATQ